MAAAKDMPGILVSSGSILQNQLPLRAIEQHSNSVDEDLAPLEQELFDFLQEFYEENLETNIARFKQTMNENANAFITHCNKILDWCYTHEQQINNTVYLLFFLINIVCFALFRFDIMSNVSIAKANSWNFSEAISAFLASPGNFMAAQSISDFLVFAVNVLGIAALVISIPVTVLIAVGLLTMPIAIPIALALLPPYSDTISCTYQLYQAVRDPKASKSEVITHSLSFGYSSFMAIGLSLFCAAAVVTVPCPALALGLMLSGMACLTISAVLRVIYFVIKPGVPQRPAPMATTNPQLKPTASTSIQENTPPVDTSVPSQSAKEPSCFTRFSLFAQSLIFSKKPTPAPVPFQTSTPIHS